MGIPGEASVTLMRSASHATALALLLLAGASPLRAQSVQGRVLALPGETPVSGALVALVDSAGGDVARAATSASGGFTLAAPHTGMYRITVNQIGWEAWRSPSFVLTTRSSQPVVLHIQAQPYTLAPLTVEARRSRCGVQLGSPEPGFHLHGGCVRRSRGSTWAVRSPGSTAGWKPAEGFVQYAGPTVRSIPLSWGSC